MDPLLSQSGLLRRKGVPSLTLLAGVLLGAFLFHNLSPFLRQPNAEPRAVVERRPLSGDERSTVEIFQAAAPSVVFITTKRRQWYLFQTNAREYEAGTGSGFIWDSDGHVVTNFHVLQGGNAFEVVLSDQSSFDAKVVGYYPDKDLAVLKIDAPRDKLIPIPLGTTEDLLVGQKVLAIGNPFGLDQTLTTGIVSALNRTLESVNQRKIEGAIQTDAAINPGNSGGPLLDSSGRLIGVNTQIYSTSGSSAGIGFAIPVDIVNEVVPQLIKFGKVIRPGLGIYAHPHNARVMRYLAITGLLIQDIQRGGAADRAGLRGTSQSRDGSVILGDIILQIDDVQIGSLQDLANTMDRYKVGDEVEILILRDGDRRKVQLELQALD